MAIKGHLVNTQTEKWYHYDDYFRLWSCDCKNTSDVSLCLSICECLENEGELREVKRQIAQKRKELGLLYGKNDEI